MEIKRFLLIRGVSPLLALIQSRDNIPIYRCVTARILWQPTMERVQMSDDQFHEPIETVKSLAPSKEEVDKSKSKGSFSKCKAKFGYWHHRNVEKFITAVETYKELEGINDADALEGLPLLFSSLTNVWWKGVRRDVKTWADAMQLLRDHFPLPKPPYQIYMELFKEKQGPRVPINPFVCKKRALLAQLPEGLHDEETEINFVYGLLLPMFRENIPRHEIKTFYDLLEKGRELETRKKLVEAKGSRSPATERESYLYSQ